MELDMIANLISKDFNSFNKKPGADGRNQGGADPDALQHVFPVISQPNVMGRPLLSNGNGRLANGNRVLSRDESGGSPASAEVINHILVANPQPHLSKVQYQLPPTTQHHDQQQLNNNLLHGKVKQEPKEDEKPFDVSNILNMSHINGHLQNVSLANTAHLCNNGALSALPFPNNHHVVAAVASSSTAPSGGNGAALLSHMQQGSSGQIGHVQQAQQDNGASSSVGQGAGGSGGGAIRTRHRSSANDSMFKCSYCPKKFADQNSLRIHMEECRVVRAHECAQCGKRFKARGGLQQHNRIHLQERPYHCHYCPKRFNQKSHLDQHERIHTGLKPFACQYCGRAFRQRSQQMGHEATHTNANSVIGASSGLSLHQISQPPAAATMVQQASLTDSSGLLQRSSERSSLASEQHGHPTR